MVKLPPAIGDSTQLQLQALRFACTEYAKRVYCRYIAISWTEHALRGMRKLLLSDWPTLTISCPPANIIEASTQLCSGHCASTGHELKLVLAT